MSVIGNPLIIGEKKIDLSSDTIIQNAVLSGYTFHGSDEQQHIGTLTPQVYYTGSSAPASSLGSNGDLYLQTG